MIRLTGESLGCVGMIGVTGSDEEEGARLTAEALRLAEMD
jgi:hypothetical protein